MAIAEDLARAEKLMNNGKAAEAIPALQLALKTDPCSHQGLLMLTQCLMRENMTDLAFDTCQELVENAFRRGKRDEVYGALKVRAMLYFRAKEFDNAFMWIVVALKYNERDNEGPIFKEMVVRKLMQKGAMGLEAREREILENWTEPTVSVEPTVSRASAPTKTVDVATPETLPVPTAAKVQNMRHDWYDSGDSITVSLYVKKINGSSVDSKVEQESICVRFKDANNFDYTWTQAPLAHKIDTEHTSFRVFGTKLEFTLAKADTSVQWKTLTRDEAVSNDTAPATVSFAKKIDWSALEEGDEENDPKDPDAFFKQLYEGADQDTRRAMMKSYTESNGTSLSMNWGEVGAKHWDRVSD